jgi:dTDP-glucose 4,6-dehydratase
MTFPEPKQPISRLPRRLLVKGSAGFIGSNFVHHWCEQYPSDRVVVLDALTHAGNRQNLADLVGIIPKNIGLLNLGKNPG